MEIQLEIRKLQAKNTLPQYHKTPFDSKLVFFKKNTFINANQSEQGIIYCFNQSE